MFHAETPSAESRTRTTAPPNIVLVHGAWADGSCWKPVIERPQSHGYTVTAPQSPLTALAHDVVSPPDTARLRGARALSGQITLRKAQLLAGD